MALTDPLTYTLNSVAYNYDRIDDGLYLRRDTTLDQPVYLDIQRTIVPTAVSSYVVKLRQSKNVVGFADDVLQVHTVMKVPHRSFTDAETKTLWTHLNSIMFNDTGMFTKLISGQR